MNRAGIERALGSTIASATGVSGGDINDAYRAQLADGRTVFVKSHARAPRGMFEAEAHGLAWLTAATADLAIPKVIAHGDDFLALEWLALDGRPDPSALGRGLAQLHAHHAPSFGLDRNNFLATLAQDNGTERDWPTFYVERRLRPLCKRAGLGLDAQLDVLAARRDVFGPDEPPSRLHGDLWWGNVSSCAGGRGRAAIFDPAVYGGHREIDLAMLALFGGLPDALIGAYEEVTPLAPGWRGRVRLYQLYPLAAHACLFGGGYGAQVASGLAHYV